MEERTIPYYSVVMVREKDLAPPAPLPEGCSFRLFAPGMEEDWSRIQYKAGAFPDLQAVAGRFQREFGGRPELLPDRMLFVCDSGGVPVGTATLWPGDDLGRPMERIHWVAVEPACQGRGLCKALLARLLETCPDASFYLTTQTISYRAIHIYRQFGFVPYLGPKPDYLRTRGGVYEEETKLAWQIIDGLLEEYQQKRG